MGKTLEMTGLNWGRETVEVTVTGVFSPIPDASHFHPRMIVSGATMDAAFNFTERMSDDAGSRFRAYFKLPDDTRPGSVAAASTNPARTRLGGDWMGATLRLQPLTDLHLYSDLSLEIEPNGSATSVSLFAALAFFILVLTGVNFVNLSAARSLERAQEIGVRRSIGAAWPQILRQFLAEAGVLVGLALGLAVLLAALVEIGLGAAFEELAQDLAPGSHTPSAAVGRFLDVGVEGLGDKPEVIGVVEDLHLASLHRPIEPMAFFLLPTLPDTCYLRVEAGEMGRGLAGVEEAWHRFFPNAPLAYEFADQFFAAVYRADRHTASSASSPVWRFSSRASDSSASLPSLPGSGVTRSVSGRPLGPL